MIPRELIDPDADKVVRRLQRNRHAAYLVGGCVRDLLLSRQPKDFDVATSATPREIKQLFRNCRIIGRRFRLAHIFFGDKIIETSTFRANPREGEKADDGELLIRRDNVFGSDTQDARRRDFTINGLFYDVQAEKVIDYVGGLADLESRVIRTIGNPNIRFREDPVRMMRAIKFAARLGFAIEPATYAALLRHRGHISKCAPPRVLEEMYRLLRSGSARRSVELLVETGLGHAVVFPLMTLFGDPAELPAAGAEEVSDDALAVDTADEPADVFLPGERPKLPVMDDPKLLAARRRLAWRVLEQLDARVASGRECTNALLLAAVMGPFVLEELLAAGVRPIQANELIMELMVPVAQQLRIARRDAERARQILLAQRRLVPSRRRRGRPLAMLRREYFREALSLYELFALADQRGTDDIAKWKGMLDDGDDSASDSRQRKRRRRRRGGRRRRRDTGALDDDVLTADPASDDDDGADNPELEPADTELVSPDVELDTTDAELEPVASG